VIVDSPDGQKRAQEFLSGWTGRNTQVLLHASDEPILVARGIDHEIEAALSDRVDLPSGGHLNIQPTEALTVIDVNSGRFTSSRTQAETVRRTNLEAAHEIPRQLRLRNVGGMVIVDFIDMESRKDQQLVLEAFQRALEDDRAKPQVGQLSDLGLVELTRRRQGQSLRELFTASCQSCSGLGVVPTLEIGYAEHRRLISTRPKDEDLLGRSRQRGGRGGSRQQSALRAASIISGRVQSTVVGHGVAKEGEEELAEVPEDILEQVPDELLDARPAAFAGSPGFNRALSIDMEEEEPGEDVGEEAIVPQSFAPARPLFEEEAEDDIEDEGLSEALGTSVLEAEKLRLELEHEPFSQDFKQEEEEEPAPAFEMPEPYSPFAAEPEPITGVYRLKPKEPQQTEPQQEDTGSEHFQSQGESNRFDYNDLNDLGQTAIASSNEFSFGGSSQDQQQPSEAGSDPQTHSWWADEKKSQQLELPLSTAQAEEAEAEVHVSAGFPFGNYNGEHKKPSDED
jgi:hypothetical protein